MEPTFRVRICNSAEIFCQRYGFGEGSQIGKLFHKTIFGFLEANGASGLPAGGPSIQIATWLDNSAPGGETVFEVNEKTAGILYGLNHGIRGAVKKDAKSAEATGRSFLVQQLKEDMLGEIK